MCDNKEVFSEIYNSFNSFVGFGDNTKIEIIGKEKVPIQINNGNMDYISNFLYAPKLKNNLLSLCQLLEKGYEIIMKNGFCSTKDKNNCFIPKSQMIKNRMFPLKLKNIAQPCSSTMINDYTCLWHLRLGHLNFNRMKLMQQKNMVVGLPLFKQPKPAWGDCIMGKRTWSPFPY